MSSYAHLLKHPVYFLGLGFGSGLAPKAPGTFGTLAAIPLVWLMQQVSMPIYAVLTVIAILAGFWICAKTAAAMGEHDHPAIVWDEIAGFMIAMIALPFTWLNVLLAFGLFRFFDIYKPGPIGWCDRKLTGGAGIMMDDVLAGVASAAVIHLGYWLLV